MNGGKNCKISDQLPAQQKDSSDVRSTGSADSLCARDLLMKCLSSTKASNESFMGLLPMSYAMSLRLGISHLNFFTPSRYMKKKKKQLPKSKHFPVSKNKMLATLQASVPRPGPSQDKQ